MSAAVIRLDPADDVGTALRVVVPGETVRVSSPGGVALHIRATNEIPAFHKVALHTLPTGSQVRKYGAVIGELTEPVAVGGLVHVHNLRSRKARAAPP